MLKSFKAAIAATAAVALTACASGTPATTTPAPGGETSSAPTTAPTTEAAALQVGLAFDVGGRGDQSFNDAAIAGVEKAKAEFGVEYKEATAVANEAASARSERLQQLIEAGFTNVVATGFVYAAEVGTVAKENPDAKFAQIDDSSEGSAGDNVMQIVFAEEQGSYLVGVAAALKSETGHLGFVGGVDTPLIKKFEAGFRAGATAVKPDIKIDAAYLTVPPDYTGFNDTAKGEAAATKMFQDGADIVYHAAGGSGGGVFNAAKAAGGWAIGVDSDQALTAAADVQDVILTSMIKRVDVGVYNFVKSIHDGTFAGGVVTLDLAADGVGYSTTGGHIDDIVPQLEEYKAKIISGEIKVPTEVA